MTTCPCGKKENFSNCCEPYIEGVNVAPTPEALMRSRYTAYTLANVEYIRDTMLSPAADGYDLEEARAWASSVVWQKLKVVKSENRNDCGFVEFMAYFTMQGIPQCMHEVSEFHLKEGQWFYVDGERR